MKLDFGKFIQSFKTNRFGMISWGITFIVVVSLLGATFWWTQVGSASPAMRPQPTASANHPQDSVNLPGPTQNAAPTSGIGRQLELKTDVSQQSNYSVTSYQVVRGDSVFALAKQFNIKPETILYSNKDTLHDSPSNLAPGMTLVIPPVDGLLYTWKDGDTIDSVASQFKAKPEDILNWPGNDIDLTNPQIKPGTTIMIPGGHRELISWMEFVPTLNRGNGTATSELGGGSCNPGPVGMPGLWPTTGPHTISGNDFSPTHLGIDITAFEGTPVLASGAGVVVYATFSQYGYGNVIEIDHGNGYATVYAHLSQFNVTRCEPVMQGQVIGDSGSTGNSTGPHLHFEVRLNGVNLNPWYIVH
jgi:murein DD-endopeptidase MepM/ murein hydrolase activator NlpD